jgi:hypothetical protein
LEGILKKVEIAFLWEYAVDSTASLCNNGVNYPAAAAGPEGAAGHLIL